MPGTWLLLNCSLISPWSYPAASHLDYYSSFPTRLPISPVVFLPSWSGYSLARVIRVKTELDHSIPWLSTLQCHWESLRVKANLYNLVLLLPSDLISTVLSFTFSSRVKLTHQAFLELALSFHTFWTFLSFPPNTHISFPYFLHRSLSQYHLSASLPSFLPSFLFIPSFLFLPSSLLLPHLPHMEVPGLGVEP